MTFQGKQQANKFVHMYQLNEPPCYGICVSTSLDPNYFVPCFISFDPTSSLKTDDVHFLFLEVAT